MQELRAGVWHRQAAHPAWKPGEDWGKNGLAVELVLATHGGPTDRAALERALD